MSLLFALAVSLPGAAFAQSGEGGRGGGTEAPAVAGELMIKFRGGTTDGQRDAMLRAHGGRRLQRLEKLEIDAVEFPQLRKARGAAVEKLINALKSQAQVEFVEPNYVYTTELAPNDPGTAQQYAWNTIDANEAWDVHSGNSSTVIAIVDTGIQRNHPDLDAKIVSGYDFVSNDNAADDGNGHGTHVAGTAAAETGNSTGGAGTCPDCKLMPVRVLDNNGSGSLANVANGIRWAADNGAKVINLSLGGPGSSTVQSAVDYAWSKGVFLACAAGNSNTSSTSSAYPAAYANCFAVASTTNTDARSSFSNYGGWVEVAAPGSNIYSTWINSGYNTISGTSMATPHVAGLAGLLASSGLSNAQIRSRICSTSDAIAGTGTQWSCGRINAYRAVSSGTPAPTPTPVPPPAGGEAIVNGGFESGSTSWTQSSSGGYQLITNTRPRTGAYSAYLGDYNNATETIDQLITVPANGTLSYAWYMTTTESGSIAYDRLRVRLLSSGGTVITELRAWSNASGAGQWRQDSISLAGYAGQTVRVQFLGTTDFSLTSSFFVDDVSVR